jgi:hypothetical protein
VRGWQEERPGPIFLARGDRFGMPQQAQPRPGNPAVTDAAESEEGDG